VTVPAVGPDRSTMTTAGPWFSATEKVAALKLMAGSLSTSVSVAVRRVPSTAPPPGLRRVRVMVSSPSPTVSSTSVSVKVAMTWPGAKTRVPAAPR